MHWVRIFLVCVSLSLLHPSAINTCEGSVQINAQTQLAAELAHLDVLSYILQQTTTSPDPPAGVSASCHQRFGWQYILAQQQHREQVCSPRKDEQLSRRNVSPQQRSTLEGARSLQHSRIEPLSHSEPITPLSSISPPDASRVSLKSSTGDHVRSEWPRPAASRFPSPDSPTGRTSLGFPSSSPSNAPVTPRTQTRILSAALFVDVGLTGAAASGNNQTHTAAPLSRPLLSSAECYLQPHQHATQGPRGGQSLCLTRNLILDSCAFSRQLTKASRFPSPVPGSVRLACEWNTTALDVKGMKNTNNKAWLVEAPQDRSYHEVALACLPGSVNVVETPTVFVMRDRGGNVAHDMELVSMMFAGLAVLQLEEIRRLGLQVVFVDHWGTTPFLETWKRISSPLPIRMLATEPYPPGTCFRTAIQLYSYYSGLSLNPDPQYTNCSAPLLWALHNWYAHLYRDIHPTPLGKHHMPTSGSSSMRSTATGTAAAESARAALLAGALVPEKVVRRTVVWLSRRNQDATRAFGRMSKWERARIITNNAEVVAALQSTVAAWNQRTCLLMRFDRMVETIEPYTRGRRHARRLHHLRSLQSTVPVDPYAGLNCTRGSVLYDFVDADLSGLSMSPEQLSLAFSLGVLVGVHGAGMAYMLLAPPSSSALVQLISSEWAHSNHPNDYKMLATAFQHSYEQLTYAGRTVNATAAAEAVTRAMDAVAVTHTLQEEERRANGQPPPPSPACSRQPQPTPASK